MEVPGEFRQAAVEFLRAAWAVLEREHVVPTPLWHPHIHVGRDYYGESVARLPESRHLEAAVVALNPRFSNDTPLGERDFANAYVFSFLEAFVALSAEEPDGPAFASVAAESSLTALYTAVRAATWEVACCRVVSHLTTLDQTGLDLAGVRLVPIPDVASSSSREIAETIGSVIKGAGTAFNRDPPSVYDPPLSVVIARSSESDPYGAGNALSDRIERFLLAARLLWSGTCLSSFEIQGETARVRRFSPTMRAFRGAGPGFASPTSLVRRTVRLGVDDGPRIEGLWTTLDGAHQPRPVMVLTSFAMALQKFQISFHAHAWYEQLVDLATALEGALSGTARTDVVLRLKTRAAALLSTERDPAAAVFGDIDRLYELRSRLVHGAEMTEKEMSKLIKSVSTVPADALPGTAMGYLVDRMRDLVRRSLLARLCLAADGDESLWPLGRDPAVDAALADDRTRVVWRTQWMDKLASFDARFAGDRPRGAVDVLSNHDR